MKVWRVNLSTFPALLSFSISSRMGPRCPLHERFFQVLLYLRLEHLKSALWTAAAEPVWYGKNDSMPTIWKRCGFFCGRGSRVWYGQWRTRQLSWRLPVVFCESLRHDHILLFRSRLEWGRDAHCMNVFFKCCGVRGWSTSNLPCGRRRRNQYDTEKMIPCPQFGINMGFFVGGDGGFGMGSGGCNSCCGVCQI